ncbi:RDD family protein [Microbacterium ulmi]|uniref:RDD family protein n=1 Tax=Microbacterium ulmi TaxID=179095 RepID=A0A7Y2LX33_9MICO|nr:putative RDD family membrane protein YckC [Microbacterium ulmi]NNH02345.1 RDD family protein [Microbacterium ulmi]
MPDPLPENTYPGERIGLPATGPGSIAKVGRRIGALAIDLASSALIAYAFFPVVDPTTDGRFANPLASNLVFFAIQVLFIPTLGGSPGHRILGMRVTRLGGGWTGVWRPALRTLLLFLVIPAVIWNADHRGLHDQAAGTVLVRS